MTADRLNQKTIFSGKAKYFPEYSVRAKAGIMQVLSVILLMFFLGCETDPFRDQKRRSSKYKIAALIGHYTETKSVVQVDEQTYNAYKIGDSYSKGTVVNKYIDSRFFFFVISKIARDASQ